MKIAIISDNPDTKDVIGEIIPDEIAVASAQITCEVHNSTAGVDKWSWKVVEE